MKQKDIRVRILIVVTSLIIMMVAEYDCRGQSAGLSGNFPFQQETFHIIPTSSPPVINGNLDDKCWIEATMVSGFISVDGEWCREQTTAYVSYDSENLYIAFLCNESQPDKIKAEKKKHDDVGIYGDDCVEIFIDVNHNHQTYYHFMVNSLGTTYEAHCEIGSGRDIRDDTWNPDYRVATSIGEKYWVVETSIPFNSLNTTMPGPEKVWGINLNRERWLSTEGEFSSWARIDNFNDPTRFGHMIFGVPEEVSYSIISLKDNMLRVKFRNGKDTPLQVKADVAIEPALKDLSLTVNTIRMGPREEEENDIKYNIENVQSSDLTFKISNPETGSIYHLRKGTVELTPPIELSIDKYYYNPNDKSMLVGLSKNTDKGTSLKLNISKEWDGKVQFLKNIPIVANRNEYPVSFDITGLPVGRYIVSASLLDANGINLYSIHRVFYKKELLPIRIPSPVKKVDIREDGVILINGMPFFPFFCGSGDSSSPLDGGLFFNVKGYHTETGLVRTGVGLPWVTNEGNDIFFLLPEEEEMLQKIREIVSVQKSEPLLFEWLIQYEAQFPMRRGKKDSVQINNQDELKKISQFIKGIDPNHLTAIEIDRLPLLPQYKDSADIIEIASGSSSYGKHLIPNLAGDVDRIREILGKGKPFFFWIGSSIPREKWRTAEDIRCASYLALMHGANGLAYHMGHGGISPTSTRHRSVYTGLSQEIEYLFPILVASEPVKLSSLTVYPADIDFCVREYNGHIYLIAVNTVNRLVKGEITFTQDTVKNPINLPLENRKIKQSKNSFTDYFTPYEPHVYEIDCTRGK